MLEASAVMVDFPAWYDITGNTFDGNWALSTGDTYIGTSLNLHNVITYEKTYRAGKPTDGSEKPNHRFKGNQFRNHVGIPSNFKVGLSSTESKFCYDG